MGISLGSDIRMEIGGAYGGKVDESKIITGVWKVSYIPVGGFDGVRDVWTLQGNTQRCSVTRVVSAFWDSPLMIIHFKKHVSLSVRVSGPTTEQHRNSPRSR